MSSAALELALQCIAVGFYIAATALLAGGTLFSRGRWRVAGSWTAALGLVPHSAGLLLRWAAAGHGPYMMRYEVLSSNAWIAVALTCLMLWRRPSWSAVGVVALPGAVLMMAVGLFASPEIRALPASLRSIWLVFHVIFNKLAVGGFLLSLGAAVLLLAKARGVSGPRLDRLPAVEALDALTVRLAGFGLIFWTMSIASGAVWANQAWGRYWGWDPIETWSLITWLVYGAMLHTRFFYKLRGPAVAWAVIACFAVSILTLFVFPFLIPSMHSAYFQ